MRAQIRIPLRARICDSRLLLRHYWVKQFFWWASHFRINAGREKQTERSVQTIKMS